MVQFFTVIVSLYLFSHAYNVLLVLTFPGPNGGAQAYTINSKMGITSSNLMKVYYHFLSYIFFKIKKKKLSKVKDFSYFSKFDAFYKGCSLWYLDR